MEKSNMVRITVLKRSKSYNIFGDNPVPWNFGESEPCPAFTDEQEFMIEGPCPKIPDGFCEGAWVGLRPHIQTFLSGGSYKEFENPNSIGLACPDGARPIMFKVERITEPTQ